MAMKAAQLGITEAGINRAFFTLDQLKRDVLYVLPTTLNASDFSKARFATALKLSPYLKQLFVDTNTVGLKSTGTNVLYIRGSRGDSNLKSIPVSELVLDELDEMDTKAIWLALERLSGQIEKHVVAISTPTVPKYGIHKLFLTSTQEHFYFNCPHCSRWTELVWPDCVEIIGETVSDPRCQDSFIKCKECKHKLDHKPRRSSWLAASGSQRTPKRTPRNPAAFMPTSFTRPRSRPARSSLPTFAGKATRRPTRSCTTRSWACPSSVRTPRSRTRCWTPPCGSTPSRPAAGGRRQALHDDGR